MTGKSFARLLVGLSMTLLSMSVFPCSMYKVTAHGKTMVGSNYDAWYPAPRVWFENGKTAGRYGVVFLGGRFDGENGFAPQSGMNEFGLTFTSQAAPPPEKQLPAAPGKKAITNRTQYLKDILATCKTIDEVRAYIDQYDHSVLINDVFLYIDKSGRYLVVEPGTMTLGSEPKYVLGNFCPSQVPDLSKIKQIRYVNGMAFLKNKIDTSLAFCTALSDTMHVCREKIGDGTLVSFIRDLNDGVIYLYFYHDYNHMVKFNLQEELAKGDHVYEIPGLFPPNAEYEQLIHYKIPQNSIPMMLFIMFSGVLFLFSSVYFLFSYFRKRKTAQFSWFKLSVVPLGIVMFYYMYVLARNINIFYFASPYKDYKFTILNIVAYVPYLLIILIVPMGYVTIKIIRQKAWASFPSIMLVFNNIIYIILAGLFVYWGLVG